MANLAMLGPSPYVRISTRRVRTSTPLFGTSDTDNNEGRFLIVVAVARVAASLGGLWLNRRATRKSLQSPADCHTDWSFSSQFLTRFHRIYFGISWFCV